MMSLINTSIIEQGIDFYGKDIQSITCMEECAELIQAISKQKRNKSSENKEHLTEEIADVLICIKLLQSIYDIPDGHIADWIISKQARMLERIKGEK